MGVRCLRLPRGVSADAMKAGRPSLMKVCRHFFRLQPVGCSEVQSNAVYPSPVTA